MVTAAQLRRRREALDISQATLAGLIGYRAETINRYENGKVDIPLTSQWALDKVLTEKELETIKTAT